MDNIFNGNDIKEIKNYALNDIGELSIDRYSKLNKYLKKNIKNRKIPFNDIVLFKIIVKKIYDKNDDYEEIINKLEALYLKLDPQTEKDKEIFLYLCDIFIKSNYIFIDINKLVTFRYLFSDDKLIQLCNYMINNKKIDIKEKIDRIVKYRKYFNDEEKYYTFSLFIIITDNSNSRYNNILLRIINKLDIKNDDFNNRYNGLYKKIINCDNYSDKEDLIKLIKEYKDIFYSLLNNNKEDSKYINDIKKELNSFEYNINNELEQLNKDDNAINNDRFNNCISNNNYYHESFLFVHKNILINNNILLLGPKECGKKTIIKQSLELLNEDIEFVDVNSLEGIVKRALLISKKNICICIKEDSKNEEEIIYNFLEYLKLEGNLDYKVYIVSDKEISINNYQKIYINYDEKLEEDLTSKNAIEFFKQYRKTLARNNIALTTKDILNALTNAGFRNLFYKKKIDDYSTIFYYYDKDNPFYSYFQSICDGYEKGISTMIFEEQLIENNSKVKVKRK